MDKDSLLTGIVLGAISPVFGYFIVEQLFNLLVHFNLMESVTGTGISRRLRTMTLLAICFNLIPFNYAKRNLYDNTLRGIVFPTIVYVAAWVWKFKDVLF